MQMSLLEILLISMVGFFTLSTGIVIMFTVYHSRLHQKEVQQHQREIWYHKSLLQGTLESQERERMRIAHDLHDEIGALLTSSRMFLNAGVSPTQTPLTESLNYILDEIMHHVRSISHDLRPVVLENLGLWEAIRAFGDTLALCNIKFLFTSAYTPVISKRNELVIYRILQELVNNTVKHAQASLIQIDCQADGVDLLLIYQDDGIGLPPAFNKSGLGMKSIESRLNLLDGTFAIPHADTGVTFIIRIASHRLNCDPYI